jgi:omega-6 fatty acid desaturase (delta-12 desaturase)
MQITPTRAFTGSTREWTRALAHYREPDHVRSVFEIIVTGGPLIVLWLLAWAALSVSYLLTLAVAVAAGCFLVRLFMIQHDCGHGAFFRHKLANDWVGRAIGVLTLTPHDVRRRSHAAHHATSGNHDKRGSGDVCTLTVREYRELPLWRRIGYRLYRHPLIMFGLGSSYLFLLRNRLPTKPTTADREEWVSTLGTNGAIAITCATLIYFLGPLPFLLVHLPIVLVAASIGVWLFSVQHQFEDTFWAEDREWEFPSCGAPWKLALRLALSASLAIGEHRHTPRAPSL